ncbi:Uncharacterised protein [Mycobacteroides abscessus subsp. abscessus]|nr:Uncharacterised protein [Mycobacteroides abscessus subsp. abscessus]
MVNTHSGRSTPSRSITSADQSRQSGMACPLYDTSSATVSGQPILR